MIRERNKELVRQLGINTDKPDAFQKLNEPLMNNLMLWSEENIPIADTIQKFFNINVKTKLIATLVDLDLDNWVGIGASWEENNQTGQIRADNKLMDFILSKAFGTSFKNQPFDSKKLNELELTLLQTFMENLETEMKKYWELDANSPHLLDTIFLVWLVESDEGEIGRIAFGMPASFKPKKKTPSIQDITDIKKLANTGIKVPIDLKVGTTKLSYSDIQSLETEDLLIFEESDISKFQWHFGEINIVLPEEDHPIFLRDLDSMEDLTQDMAEKISKHDNDPLTSLPLELSAEFQKVRIPLKQVLELKSGGVLPLGSV